MVARILGKLLNMVGILPTDKVVEVQRTDLVGEFVGHTAPEQGKRSVNDGHFNLSFQGSSMYLSSFLANSKLMSDSRSRRWDSFY